MKIIGYPVIQFYHPDCIPDFKKAFQLFKSKGSVVNAELAIRTKTGKKIPIRLNVTAVRNNKGKITHSNSVWHDISDVKQLETELAAANKDLEKKVKRRTNELQISTKNLEQALHQVSDYKTALDEASIVMYYKYQWRYSLCK